MADTIDNSTAPPRKGIRRLQIGLNVILQIALLLFLVLMVNYLGFEHYRRWDFSRDKKFELSDKTKRFLDSMKGKARITVFFAPNNPLTGDVQQLLMEYQYAGKGKVDVEIIDPERNLTRAKEVLDKYKVVSDDSLLILEYEGRNKSVKASEMADVDPGNPMLGEQPKVTAFKGEQALTGALIDLVEGKKNSVGYVLGHKEPSIESAPPQLPMMMQQQQPPPASPISVLKQFIENDNVKFEPLNLSEIPAIPAETKTIMIVGPQYDFSDREIKMLHDFWEKQGHIFMLLDPAAKTPKLDAFVNELGVRVNDDRLMAMMKTGIQEVALIRDVIGRFLPGTPVTQRLGDVRGAFVGGTASLTLDQQRAQQANIKLTPLIEAQKGYWSEPDYNTTDEAKLQADAAKAPQQPLVFGVAIEKGAADERVQTNASRMILVSNATFVQDAALTQDQQALDFASASVNWLMSREQLIGIAPKIPKTLTFSLNEQALSNMRWIVLILLPLIPAVLGTAVWWQRRA
ncbi:MAG: Gldg family protein [Chthoniobacterales bacterium]